jgi:hypothetical protein
VSFPKQKKPRSWRVLQDWIRHYRDLLEPASLGRVREACEAIFANRAKHPWPPELTVYPSWAETYRAIAEEEAFPVEDVEEAASRVQGFIREIDAAGGG